MGRKHGVPEDYVVVDSRNVKQIGGSLYVGLPAKLVKDLEVRPGDSVSFLKDESRGIVVLVNASKLKVDVPGIGKARMRFSASAFAKLFGHGKGQKGSDD